MLVGKSDAPLPVAEEGAELFPQRSTARWALFAEPFRKTLPPQPTSVTKIDAIPQIRMTGGEFELKYYIDFLCTVFGAFLVLL